MQGQPRVIICGLTRKICSWQLQDSSAIILPLAAYLRKRHLSDAIIIAKIVYSSNRIIGSAYRPNIRSCSRTRHPIYNCFLPPSHWLTRSLIAISMTINLWRTGVWYTR